MAMQQVRWVTAAVVTAATLGAGLVETQSRRTITQVTGDLYLAKNDNHYTVFLVTPQGIVLADPISRDFSMWLKSEITARFRNRPVRFVLHSHHHFDHASGAEVWNDSAEIFAHESFGAELKKSAAAVPDRYAEVRLPETTYQERRRITLGGVPIEMVHVGPNHSLDASAIFFPEQRAVFVVDFITLRNRFPFSLAGGAPLEAWINSVRAVEALDATTIVGGHGDVGTRADLAAYRGYLEDLFKVVRDGIANGQTVEQLQASSALDRYKDWVNFPLGKNQNIGDAYALMRAGRR